MATLTETAKPATRQASPFESEPPSNPAWYERTAEVAFCQLKTTPAGMSNAEAHQRLAQYGDNEWTAKKRCAFVRFVRQLQNALDYIVSARSIEKSVCSFNPLSNRWVLLPIAATVVTPLMIPGLPFLQTIFKTAAFPATRWPIILLSLLPGLMVVELEKFIRNRFAARR